ncbi:hypothetical protein V6N12_065935 [Hibiscus sabdariffa]|uniref:Uncharacterized protein n=1 Tax=Hibiscus sabdariffa TaxID=183260 RepID=A0ABR2BGC2_9ROSI
MVNPYSSSCEINSVTNGLAIMTRDIPITVLEFPSVPTKLVDLLQLSQWLHNTSIEQYLQRSAATKKTVVPCDYSMITFCYSQPSSTKIEIFHPPSINIRVSSPEY